MYLHSVILPMTNDLTESSFVSGEPDPELLSYLSAERRRTVLRYRKPEDRALSLFGALTVRYLAENHTKIPQRELRFSRTVFGKPYLENDPDFHFSLSHCKGLVFAVCSDTAPVGCDAEVLPKADPAAAFSDSDTDSDPAATFSDSDTDSSAGIDADAYKELLSCLHEEERKAVLKAPDEETRRLRFYEIWTRKEAYVKRSGEGMNREFASFDTTKLLSEFLAESFENFSPHDGSDSAGTSRGTPNNTFITSICAAPELLKEHSRTVIFAEDLRSFFRKARSSSSPLPEYPPRP